MKAHAQAPCVPYSQLTPAEREVVAMIKLQLASKPHLGVSWVQRTFCLGYGRANEMLLHALRLLDLETPPTESEAEQ